MQRRRKATTLAAVVFAATTLLSSCGLYDDAGSDTSSGETSPTDKKLSKQDIEVGATATGGKAGVRATGVPVKIGFITDNGIQGLEGEPFLNSMKAAVAFINNDLGGVDGHPLEVVTCEITQTEDEGTVCAQKMVNDPSIVAVVAGDAVLGRPAEAIAVDRRAPAAGLFRLARWRRCARRGNHRLPLAGRKAT